MALCAVFGGWRWVPEFWDRPFRRPVALRTVVAEQTTVPVFRLVTGRAVQQCFFRFQMGEVWLRGCVAFFEPMFHLRDVGTGMQWLAF